MTREPAPRLAQGSSMTPRLPASAVLLAALLVVPMSAPIAAQDDDRDAFERAIVDVLREQGLVDEARAEALLELARQRAARDAAEIEMFETNLQRLRAPDVQARGGRPGDLMFRSADGNWSL